MMRIQVRSRAMRLLRMSVLIGCCVPALVAIGIDMLRGAPLLAAVRTWFGNLFVPGYNEFALWLINAAPFFGLAGFSVLHLSSGKNEQRRFSGVAGALTVGAAFLIYGLVGIRG